MSLSRRKFLKVLGGTLIFPGSALSQSRPAPPGNLRMSGGGKRTYVADTGNSVTNGANLQSALDQAQSGDTLLLHPGATFTGNFLLKPREGSSYITVKSAAPVSDLPARGVRVGPSYSGRLPRIATPNAQPSSAGSRAKASPDRTSRLPAAGKRVSVRLRLCSSRPSSIRPPYANTNSIG